MASSDKKHHGTVVVALPAKNDPVHSIGEEPKHATVAYLGDDVSDDDLAKVRSAVADYAGGNMSPFPERVKSVGSLGDEGARVWKLHSDDGLASIHGDMAKHPVVGPLMAKADQFPTYTPHVTIGYPAEDADCLDDETETAAKGVDSVRFDRLGVWRGDDQTEHPLTEAASLGWLTEVQRTAVLGPVLAELAGQETPGSAGSEARLKKWWRENFDWGTPGDFAACVVRATEVFGKHGVDIDPKAWCARMHHDATGAWPGHAPGEQAAHESAEEAPMGDDLRLVETVTITEAAAAQARETGEFPIQFISPGWGSSGYYSPEVVQEAARERVIPAGTHMYADHPTDAEVKARPARSIKDLMAVTTEDARLSESGALVGRAKVVPAWQPFVEAVRNHIGVSIRGDAKDIREGTAEGRRGRIIEGLAHVQSVDFVTRAGRGGKVLELLESAVAEGTEIREDLDVALVEAKYDAEQLAKMADKGHAMKNPQGDPSYPIADEADLRNAIHAVGRGSGDHAAIRAHIKKRAKDLGCSSLIPDDWASASTSEAADVAADIAAAVARMGDPTHVPAVRPDGSTTTESQEKNMGQKTIEESEYNRLVEDAGRATTLEAALTKTQGELTEARAALLPNKDLREARARVELENDLLRAEKAAAPMIAEGLEDTFLGEVAKKRIAGELLDGVTLKEGDEGRSLDTDALTEAINTKVRVAEAEAEDARKDAPIVRPGLPRGLGRSGGLLVEQKLGEYTDTTADAIGKAFGLSEASAKTAGKGRI